MTDERRSPYLTFHPPTAAVAVAGSLALVVVLSLLTKLVVEATTAFSYTIHWFETVPFIVVAVAFVINANLNERRRRRQRRRRQAASSASGPDAGEG